MISDEFKSEGHWGLSSAITVHNCDSDKIRNGSFIKQFLFDLIDYIDMKRHGEPVIERFGSGSLVGYSVMQLIETSSITMHFSEVDNRAFIDIFSCKGYEPDETAEYCEDYLSGTNVTVSWQFRD